MALVLLECPQEAEKSQDIEVELLDMYRRLRSAGAVACHFKINGFSRRTIAKKKKKKKELHEAVSAAIPAGVKN